MKILFGAIVATIVLVAAVLCFVSPGWLARDVVNAADAEADVLASLPGPLRTEVDVRCPDGEPADPGHTFVCTLTFGSDFRPVKVSIGPLTQRPYRVEVIRTAVLDSAGVEKGVVQILGEHAQVDNVQCPDSQQVENGHLFHCTATVDGEQKKIPITITDAEADPPVYRVDAPE